MIPGTFGKACTPLLEILNSLLIGLSVIQGSIMILSIVVAFGQTLENKTISSTRGGGEMHLCDWGDCGALFSFVSHACSTDSHVSLVIVFANLECCCLYLCCNLCLGFRLTFLDINYVTFEWIKGMTLLDFPILLSQWSTCHMCLPPVYGKGLFSSCWNSSGPSRPKSGFYVPPAH